MDRGVDLWAVSESCPQVHTFVHPAVELVRQVAEQAVHKSIAFVLSNG